MIKTSDKTWKLDLGASVQPDGSVKFRVWAPRVSYMKVKLFKGNQPTLYPMRKDSKGYFTAKLTQASENDRYSYFLGNDRDRPDPVSRYQPEGVHTATRKSLIPREF